MAPLIPEALEPDPSPTADLWADRRANERQAARPGCRLEVRRDESGPDLAVALMDVSAGGLQAAVRGPLEAGDRAVVWLCPPAESWVYRGLAVVCWRVEGAEGTALVGLRLRTRLPDAAVADLAAPEPR